MYMIDTLHTNNYVEKCINHYTYASLNHYSPIAHCLIYATTGCCNPRYMRSTMYTVPCSNDLLNNIKVPMGLIVQPMATVKSNEVR